ncbi:MAG: type IV pilus twitching motility protein PilT [Bdellovibrionota bacterium]|nr:type IV pili twitching motility protein PilT [Pseudobdellovibrionaceae bacterium]|tara:strand:+ start:16224 stop:17369 length:1146 start_codon:yes stop_codon:yes gene_type:complete
MAKIDQLFQKMVELGASDLHLTTGAKPLLRLHGKMTPLGDSILTPQETQSLLFEILTEKQKKEFVRDWELDCAYSLEGVGRFRVNIFMQRKGLGAVFRTIPVEILSAEKLGLPPQILNLTKEHKGLIVVTGPTGSGKSTTLAAMIDYINKNESAHILTVEDPVEFVHENQKSLVNQREVGSHTKSFANALKAALREDPDIILVGEMRDLETISLAMTAAETGHLVFGTLHTNNAAKTVDRIIDVFPQEQQAQIRVMLSESLKAVVAQGLLPTADGKGRCAAIEILVNTHAVGNLIREGKTFQIPSIMQTSSGKGMITFENNIRDLVRSGKISLETGNAFLGKKEETPEAPSRPDPLNKPTISADDKKLGLSSIANRLKKNG